MSGAGGDRSGKLWGEAAGIEFALLPTRRERSCGHERLASATHANRRGQTALRR